MHTVLGVRVAAAIMMSATYSSEASARRLASGQFVPESAIVENHPGAKAGGPVSLEMLRLYDPDLVNLHCYHMKPDGKPGRITVRTITHATRNFLPNSVLANQIPMATLNRIKRFVAGAEHALVDYALAVSANDVDKAISLVKAAEAHDAHCTELAVAEFLASVDLNKKGLGLGVDESGKWLAIRIKPESIARAIADNYNLIKSSENVAGIATETYERAYARLEEMKSVGDQSPEVAPEPPPRTKRIDIAPDDVEPKEKKIETETGGTAVQSKPAVIERPAAVQPMKSAHEEMLDALKKVREYCLHEAIPDCS